MTSNFSDGQRQSLALMYLAAAVDNLNTIVFNIDAKPKLPDPAAFPPDVFIQNLTQHINYGVAQFAALQNDTALLLVDEADDKVDALEEKLGAYQMREYAREFFGLSSVFAAPYGGGVNRPTPTPDPDSQPPTLDPFEDDVKPAAGDEPIPEGVFYDPDDSTFRRTVDGADWDDFGGPPTHLHFYQKWWARSDEFPQKAPKVSEPEPDRPAQAVVEGESPTPTQGEHWSEGHPGFKHN